MTDTAHQIPSARLVLSTMTQLFLALCWNERLSLLYMLQAKLATAEEAEGEEAQSSQLQSQEPCLLGNKALEGVSSRVSGAVQVP